VLRYFTPKSVSHRLLLIRVTDTEKKASLTEFGPCAWWCFLVHIHLITYHLGEIPLLTAEKTMPETALMALFNLSHNVPAIIEAAKTSLIHLTTF
jgi:hypothetical protein